MSALICTTLYPVSEKERIKRNITPAVRELAESAKENGLEITAVVRIKPLIGRNGISFPRKRVVSGIRVYDLPIISFKHHFLSFPSKLIAYAFGLQKEPYKTIASHISGQFARAENIFKKKTSKHILVAHATDIKHPYFDWAAKRADKIFARSNAIKIQIEKHKNHYVNGTLSSGIKSDEIAKFSKKRTPNEINFIFAGKLEKRKNLDCSLEALSLLPDNINWKLNIFGTGPQASHCKKVAQNLNISEKTFFHGYCDRAKILKSMKNADILLMPSAPETFGLAFLEAMSQGCVVIGHKGWGIDGIISDGYGGFLVESPSASEIQKKILTYLTSDRELLHKQALELAKKHTSLEAGRAYKQALQNQ